MANRKNPGGMTISFSYTAGLVEMRGINVIVNYEIYDGLPLICKWVEIKNNSGRKILVNKVVNEIIAVTEEQSSVVGRPEQMRKQNGIYVESNYAFNNAMNAEISDQATHWNTDPEYTSQVNYDYMTPCLLEIYPNVDPCTKVTDKNSFTSIRTFELLQDSYDYQRKGLAKRKMYSTIAPWTTQNPIFMHLVTTDTLKVKDIIDQCVETGYEMIILSFGSGLNMEDTSAVNIGKYKRLADYAHSKGIFLGGYSLFSSRRINDDEDVIDPKTGLPDKGAMFGAAPCLGSKWGISYIEKLKYFLTKTGFDILENDGPYPGDQCASTKHPGHTGLADSQWKQMELEKSFFKWCNENGIYVNAPDWYFLDGSNKTGLGYREVNFSLPREEQVIINRQNIFDGTIEKLASMGWGFVPLSIYQGGGSAATIEPLKDHLDVYENLMMQYYGAGIQACYRGPRLFDDESTKQLVKKTISWYKKYFNILNSDMIHLRRADGRDWDGWIHVNPNLKEKGLLLLFNPLKEKIKRKIKVSLYYTGLTDNCIVKEKEGSAKKYKLNRNYEIEISVTIESQSYNWYLIE